MATRNRTEDDKPSVRWLDDAGGALATVDVFYVSRSPDSSKWRSVRRMRRRRAQKRAAERAENEERAEKEERAAKKAATNGCYQLRRLSGKPLRKYLERIGHTKADAAKLAESIAPVTKYETLRDCLRGQNVGGVPGIVLEMEYPDGRVQKMITACRLLTPPDGSPCICVR